MDVQNPHRNDIHVEIVVPTNCPSPLREIRSKWLSFLQSGDAVWEDSTLQSNVLPNHLRTTYERFDIVSDLAPKNVHAYRNARFHCHAYVLSDEEPMLEELAPAHEGDEFVPACENITLPHRTLDGLWESLIFKTTIKVSLLNYAQSAMLFSEMGISNNIVNWNRLILLHGPPGTGKTSLCRALAHKLAIRLSHRFDSAQLLDIQSHSLFSKWFSTSGKLINRLFELVREMVQDNPNALICVLLDEVESLASTRSELGGDPADSMRAVNALLTSIDRLKLFPNVLIMATSNMTAKVDAAFLDRADLTLFIGNPIKEARIEIMRSCLVELQRVGLVQSGALLMNAPFEAVALASEGLSARALRRLPLQAHALYLRDESTPVPIDQFLSAVLQTVNDVRRNIGGCQ